MNNVVNLLLKVDMDVVVRVHFLQMQKNPYPHHIGTLFSTLLTLFSLIVFAKEITLPPLSVSPYADTEVSTNIAFNGSRSDVKAFDFKFTLEGSSSNSIKVAFGRDADGDGNLSFAETGAVYGWRNGCYFAESVVAGERYEENVASGDDNAASQIFSVSLKTTRDYAPKDFSAAVGSQSVFENLSEGTPSWLYRPEWNLRRITRRGTSAPAEWFNCKIGYAFFFMIIR